MALVHCGSCAWSVGLSVSRTGLLSLLQATQPRAAAWGLGGYLEGLSVLQELTEMGVWAQAGGEWHQELAPGAWEGVDCEDRHGPHVVGTAL